MRRVLLDTDLAMGTPGSDIDDGFALALALADPEITVESITTVNGNTDVDTATRLTRELLDRLGHRDLPVVRGASCGLRGWRRTDLPARLSQTTSGRQRPGDYAAVHLVEQVTAEPGAFTVVAIGPLTNVALALALEPGVAQCVEEIVVMGGVFMSQTNRASMPGEFNTYADPDASAIVLASGAPLRFVGLDVTLQVRLTRAHTAAMRGSGSEFGAFAADCADGWIDHLERENPGDTRHHGTCALHDPLTVAAAARPDLVTWRRAQVAVETGSQLTRGVMVADFDAGPGGPKPNCSVAVGVDSKAFLDLFLERIGSL